MLPSFKGNLRPYGNCIRSFWDLIGNENLRRTSCLVSAGLKCLALGVASASNTRLFALLDFKRTRTENLLILRWKQNRLSQVLTLFYSRIQEQNFRFGMIYDCLFESVWFTFREKVAPAKQTFGSLQVVIRVMNDKLQEAEENNKQTTKQVLWLSFLWW